MRYSSVHDVIPPYTGDWRPQEFPDTEIIDLEDRLSERNQRNDLASVMSAAQRYFASDEHDAPDDLTILCSEIGIPPKMLNNQAPIASTISSISHELQLRPLADLARHQPGIRVLLLPDAALPTPAQMLELPTMRGMRYRTVLNQMNFSIGVGFVALSRNAPTVVGFADLYDGWMRQLTLDAAALIDPNASLRIGGDNPSWIGVNKELGEPFL
jgi:hypothetical protein